MIRFLICDDEPLAVERLRDLVGRVPVPQVVGTATDGRSALAAVAELAPDALLLDVEMPALDGFDVVEALAKTRAAPTPLIVFVTAYPQFAAHAFDTGAIDFLTKPVRLARLDTAIERVRRAIDDRDAAARLAELARQIEALRQERAASGGRGGHLWVQRRGENVRLDLAPGRSRPVGGRICPHLPRRGVVPAPRADQQPDRAVRRRPVRAHPPLAHRQPRPRGVDPAAAGGRLHDRHRCRRPAAGRAQLPRGGEDAGRQGRRRACSAAHAARHSAACASDPARLPSRSPRATASPPRRRRRRGRANSRSRSPRSSERSATRSSSARSATPGTIARA